MSITVGVRRSPSMSVGTGAAEVSRESSGVASIEENADAIRTGVLAAG
jgi:hypothetical protein